MDPAVVDEAFDASKDDKKDEPKVEKKEEDSYQFAGDSASENKVAHLLAEEKVLDVHLLCRYCQQVPCLMEQGLYEKLMEEAEYIQACDVSNAVTNREMRFKLYRHATRWIHGHLGKGVRKELPVCVRGEIMDFAHDHFGKYTGFQEKGSCD